MFDGVFKADYIAIRHDNVVCKGEPNYVFSTDASTGDEYENEYRLQITLVEANSLLFVCTFVFAFFILATQQIDINLVQCRSTTTKRKKKQPQDVIIIEVIFYCKT